MKLEEALLRVGADIKEAMIAELKANGSYVTGDLANSIQYEVQIDQDGIGLARTMLKYGEYVDQGIGRGPGKMPPSQDIINWLTIKRIPIPQGLTTEQFAYLIARKVGKMGTHPKPRPFVAPSINAILKGKGKELLQDAGVNEVQAKINEELQDVKFEQ